MEKINIAELLRGCPRGMELDCTMYDKVILVGVDNDLLFPIKVRRKDGCLFTLTKYGQYCDSDYAKCVIFPKGKTTWEGFQRPFMDGDIVATQNGIWIGIHKRMAGNAHEVYLAINHDCLIYNDNIFCFERLATEEEKEKLFQAIKDNGYKWNQETKTLEKLVEPKFKVGDIVRSKNCIDAGNFIIVCVKENSYSIDIKNYCIEFKDQDNYELVPNKFDINTLKALQPVLVRNTNGQVWTMDLFSHKIDTNKGLQISFVCVGHCPNQCIPYECNEHLLGTTDDCDEYFKTWE